MKTKVSHTPCRNVTHDAATCSAVCQQHFPHAACCLDCGLMPSQYPTPNLPDELLNDPQTVLRLALYGARMGTWVRDLTDDSVIWSPELEAIFGLTPGGFGGSKNAFMSLVHPDDLAALRRAVDSAVIEGGDYSIEFRFKHASGEWRWMDGRGKAVYDSDGKPIKLYGVGMDISERKTAESARAHLAAIVESAEDAIISKTLDGLITSWNVGAAHLFGYTSQEMVGTSIMRLIPDGLQDEEQQILSKLRRGERIEQYETVRVAKDGRKIHVSLTVSPIRDTKGNIVGAAKIAHDISKLHAIAAEREKLLESERAARSDAERLSHIKDEFLATLSHELRTPLNAILGWATLLRQPALSDKDRVRGIETVERNARAQAQMINELLDMSRIISGKIHLDVQPIQLHQVVTGAIEAIRPSADAKNIHLRTLLDSTIGTTRGDPNRLQQVLWNLLSNAVKFTPTGGRIQVVLQRVDDYVDIIVEDTGLGIRPEFLPYVFDRFRQADASTTRLHGGLGLGLSIVRNLVELHGGTVRVMSPGANLGSTFVVNLPVSVVGSDEVRQRTSYSATEQELDAVDLPRLDGAVVLVVDDEMDARLLLSRILDESGAHSIVATSASEALDILSTTPVDILVGDIGMPGTDGYQLIEKVRALDAQRAAPLPAVAVTAYARTEDRQRSLLAGYQMHLSKPVEARELIAAIASLLKLSR